MHEKVGTIFVLKKGPNYIVYYNFPTVRRKGDDTGEVNGAPTVAGSRAVLSMEYA